MSALEPGSIFKESRSQNKCQIPADWSECFKIVDRVNRFLLFLMWICIIAKSYIFRKVTFSFKFLGTRLCIHLEFYHHNIFVPCNEIYWVKALLRESEGSGFKPH